MNLPPNPVVTLLQLVAQLADALPAAAPPGTRARVSAGVRGAHGVHQVALAARIDKAGQRREQCWCDGTRVTQAVLRRLTCNEGECPHVKQVRAQWTAFHRLGSGSGSAAPLRLQAKPLIEETVLRHGQGQVVARPARFGCFTACPNGAHPPLQIDKPGYDLFEGGVCVAGGVVEAGGQRRPRLPTLADAEAFLLARRLEAQAMLALVRGAASGAPD